MTNLDCAVANCLYNSEKMLLQRRYQGAGAGGRKHF